MKLFSKEPDPYAHIVDFIDAAIQSRGISDWLVSLENEPENMRAIRIAEIKHKMEFDHAPQEHMEILELMSHFDILQAMNRVIGDVRRVGLNTRKFLKKKDTTTYNLLISAIAAALK